MTAGDQNILLNIRIASDEWDQLANFAQYMVCSVHGL